MTNLDSTYKIPQLLDKRVNVSNVGADLPTLKLSRSFYKKPINSIIALLSVVLLVELIAWVVVPQMKADIYEHYETNFRYIKNFIFGFIVPELCTLVILMFLINQLHLRLKWSRLPLKSWAILRYQLSFLPLFLIAFFVFFPITLNVRYLLREFPHYTFVSYSYYIYHAFTWDTYLLYLPFVLILGYLIVNMSLFKDFIAASQRLTAPTQTTMTPSILTNDFQNERTPDVQELNEDYKQCIAAKDYTGDVVLNAEECYYFESAGKSLNVYHPNGTFRKIKSLSSLEGELDPQFFCRVSRQHIINLRFVKSFSYWEKGKYLIHLNTPDSSSPITIARAQLQGFKVCLESFVLKEN